MNFSFSDLLLFSGIFLFLGIIVTKPSQRFGFPALIIYMAVGFVFGNGGEYDFLFDFPEAVSAYSQLAIGFIVFIGGLSTSMDKIRCSWKEGVSLASVGVFVTTLLVAAFTSVFLGYSLEVGLLIGAVLSATDSAAVYAILESKKLKLKENTAETLELESSTNDPMAFFLTLALTLVLAQGQGVGWHLLLPFLQQTAFGFFLGILFGSFFSYLLDRLNLETPGLYPVLILSMCFVLLGLSPLINANSLLALFVAGVLIRKNLNFEKLKFDSFFESLSWLMRISLFMVLGLQADPPRMLENIGISLSITLFLIFIGRPIAVFASLVFSKSSFNKKLFISWVGLRGATPIAFALIPLTYDLEIGDFLFDVAFQVVCLSVFLQSASLDWMARKLKLVQSA